MKKKKYVCPDTGETFFKYKDYSKYLRSSHWRTTRQRKLIQQNYTCEICKQKLPSQNLHIHHKTYKNIGNEPLSDLMCLCEDCHNELHRKRKEEKQKTKNNNAGKYEKLLGLIIKHMNKMSKADRQRALTTLIKKYGGE